MGKKAWFANSLRRDACILGSIVVGTAALCAVTMHHSVAQHPRSIAAGAAEATHRRELFVQNCASCHGLKAQGLPHQGADLQTSRFIAEQTDYGLIKFLRTGRQPGDPNSIMGLQMPARGGNVTLDDQHLADIVAYLRKVQRDAASPATQPAVTMTSTGSAGE